MVKKKRGDKKGKRDLKKEIINIFHKHPNQAFNYKQMCGLLKIRETPLQKLVNSTMIQMVSEGSLIEQRRGKYKLKSKPERVVGTVDMTSNGSAFILVKEMDEDVFIPQKHLNTALNGDTVEVLLKSKKGKRRPEGIIKKVLERKRQMIVGTLEVSQNHAFLIPDEFKLGVDIFIPKSKLNEAINGQKVIVRITDWPQHENNPEGEVVEILGMPGDHQTEMHAIIAEYGLPTKFPQDVEDEANRIEEEISKEETKNRKDFREVTTFTIDPDDAKDFDDALSIEKIDEDHLEIGIHIADVSHYVKPNSKLDKEAYRRATSVYLVDRVIPMLPEKLSNGICSLRPKEEKLCFSVVLKVTNNGEIRDRWIGRTVINSDRRFTYDEVQKIIEDNKGEFSNEISTLNKIAKYHRENRFDKGAINFEKVEVKFKLDKHGNPTDVIIKESKDAHKLIEEFMLLANKAVAEFGGKGGKNQKPRPFVYRIHEAPDPEKMREFNEFLGQFGYNIKTGSHKQVSSSYNSLLKKIKGKGEENMIEQLAIRTMSKAIYSTDSIGHYGLAFDYYTHFTSPIRRYPDIMVHRILEKYLNKQSYNSNILDEQCNHCSEREKVATEAERASIKYKQVEYLKDHVGTVFNGIISGVSEWGIYVEIIENKCEGMVRMRDMKEDYFYFDEKNYAAVGKRYGTKYHLGDEVFVRIKKADLVKKQLDFELMET